MSTDPSTTTTTAPSGATTAPENGPQRDRHACPKGMLPTSSSRWFQTLPRGRMRWPMVLERTEKIARPSASWQMVEEPAFIACLTGSTLFVAEQKDGSWTLYDARNMTATPEMYGMGFEEAREIAVLVHHGVIEYQIAFSR